MERHILRNTECKILKTYFVECKIVEWTQYMQQTLHTQCN